MQRPCGTASSGKVLVVTGDSSTAEELPDLLRGLGHEVVGIVSSGEELLRFAGDHACDLVVMDAVLKGPMDPVDVVASFEEQSRVPMVFLTPDSDDETIWRILDSGPVSLVVKPVTKIQLRAAVGTAIRLAKGLEPIPVAEDCPRAIFEAAPDSIFVRDKTLRFLYVNPAAERLFGIPRSDIVGKTCGDLLDPQLEAHIANSDHRVLSGEEVEEELRVQIRGREEVLHVVRFPIRESSGEPVAIGAVCRTLTKRKNDQDALVHSARQEAVAEMTSKLAFHFNNVLQVILGRSQLAAAQMEFGSFSGARQNLEHIQASCRDASDIITRLQLFSRCDRESTAEPAGIVDLTRIVGQVLQKNRGWFNTTGRNRSRIGLRLGLAEGCYVHSRERDLAEVASNLVRNAAEALPHGGEVTVRTLLHNGSVLLEVQDNGVGIPEEDIPKVFEPFWTTKQGQAAGMSLALSRAIVQRHGGEISVESRVGNGTAFTVRLPFAERPCATIDTSSSHSTAPACRILVVDDMETVLTALEDALRFHGQEVLTASSGEEAIMVFEDYEVDVVVCDLRMAGLDGWDVAEHIRKSCGDFDIPKTPFILLTACTEPVDTEKLPERGVDAVIRKPVHVVKLLEVIAELMNG